MQECFANMNTLLMSAITNNNNQCIYFIGEFENRLDALIGSEVCYSFVH
jgi:hypothetical protein